MPNPETFDSIERFAAGIKKKLDSSKKKNVMVLYAFNATGKTRLTSLIEEGSAESEEESGQLKTLRYNAFMEDAFHWDNENYILRFDTYSWFVSFIKEQGLENNIAENFKAIINDKIEPTFDFELGEVQFNFVSGDDQRVDSIKISKGEESVFIWCVFFTILEIAIEALNTDVEEDRSTDIFNNLKYIIIDDPVSSIDDTKIIGIAILLKEVIKKLETNEVKFLITTHHALFYNVIINELKQRKADAYTFSRSGKEYTLAQQGDAPFAYHLSVIALIQKAVSTDALEKYHFNLFRAVLEKTSNFLGYCKWSDCLSEEYMAEFIRLLNLYSHDRLSEIEGKEISLQHKTLFKDVFNTFTREFKWKSS